MPTYAYYCPECDAEEEVFMRKIVPDNYKKICPKCGAEMKREIFAPMGMSIFGLGNYIQSQGYNNEKDQYNFNRKRRHEKKKNS